jgi:hypothetical protein
LPQVAFQHGPAQGFGFGKRAGVGVDSWHGRGLIGFFFAFFCMKFGISWDFDSLNVAKLVKFYGFNHPKYV